jgi:alkylhydroperoxidase family enzyme
MSVESRGGVEEGESCKTIKGRLEEVNTPLVGLMPKDVEEPFELVSKIKERRPNGELMNLDRMLIHSPSFAAGWNHLLGNVRREMSALADQRLLELAILVVGIQNGAIYEVIHHTKPFLEASSCKDPQETLEEITYLTKHFQYDEAKEELIGTNLFNIEERLVIQIAIGITKFEPTSVSETIEKLKRWKAFKQEEVGEEASASSAVVELVGAVSAYNMVSRFLVFTEGILPEKGSASEMIDETISDWWNAQQGRAS